MQTQVQTRKSILGFWVHIIEHMRKEPYGTSEWIDIKRIVIPIEFATSHPSPKKFNTYKKFYIDNGYFDKPIEVQENDNSQNSDLVFLRDGYIRYLIARKMKLKEVPIRWYKKGDNKQ